jgi:hypothetical protein
MSALTVETAIKVGVSIGFILGYILGRYFCLIMLLVWTFLGYKCLKKTRISLWSEVVTFIKAGYLVFQLAINPHEHVVSTVRGKIAAILGSGYLLANTTQEKAIERKKETQNR